MYITDKYVSIYLYETVVLVFLVLGIILDMISSKMMKKGKISRCYGLFVKDLSVLLINTYIGLALIPAVMKMFPEFGIGYGQLMVMVLISNLTCIGYRLAGRTPEFFGRIGEEKSTDPKSSEEK